MALVTQPFMQQIYMQENMVEEVLFMLEESKRIFVQNGATNTYGRVFFCFGFVENRYVFVTAWILHCKVGLWERLLPIDGSVNSIGAIRSGARRGVGCISYCARHLWTEQQAFCSGFSVVRAVCFSMTYMFGV